VDLPAMAWRFTVVVGGGRCWRYAQEAIIKVVIIHLYVYDKCLYTML
jgi:uridylate kinase